MTWPGIIAVFVGGGIGSLMRFGMSHIFKNFDVSSMVWATFTSNVLASAILGWVIFRMAPTLYSPLYLFLAIGVCGGFSTFSTFSLETVHLIKVGQIGLAIINVLGSVLACVILLLILSKTLK